MRTYVIEFMTVRNPEWRPMVTESYIDRELAEMMMKAWVKASPPDVEFRVSEYKRA